jgi:ankyrin repeat protein
MLRRIGLGNPSKARVDSRADANGANRLGYSALEYAARARRPADVELVDLLLCRGADPNRASDDGFTPLMQAVWMRSGQDCTKVARRLIAAGADIHRATNDGWTALHYAALCDDRDSVTLLLDAGADPTVANRAGEMPADIAQGAVAELLRNATGIEARTNAARDR